MTSLSAQATSLGEPEINVDQSGRNNIFFGNVGGVVKQRS